MIVDNFSHKTCSNLSLQARERERESLQEMAKNERKEEKNKEEGAFTILFFKIPHLASTIKHSHDYA